METPEVVFEQGQHVGIEREATRLDQLQDGHGLEKLGDTGNVKIRIGMTPGIDAFGLRQVMRWKQTRRGSLLRLYHNIS